MTLDPAIIDKLEINPSRTTKSPFGKGMSSASTFKITTKLDDGSEKFFFMKTLKGKDGPLLVQGEHESLQAIHTAVPDLCPKSYGFGAFREDADTSFLILEFLQLSPTSIMSTLLRTSVPRKSLATKLAQLHKLPAPIPEGYSRAQFGFPVTTCCGDSVQDNSYKESWADFFAENRLRHILVEAEKKKGEDTELRRLVEDTISRIVPRLIGDDHLNNGKGVIPVVVHGDLWRGNAAIASAKGQASRDIIFDPSGCYAHNEYEIGIMKIFGGFGSSFFAEYQKHLPKSEPANEYEDRVSLYEIYHHLNHYALFGNVYRFLFFGGRHKNNAVNLMKNLLSKYGDERSGK